MIIGEYWIIREKSSGLVFPELSKKRRGGYTSTEPTSPEFGPRLFASEKAAKCALTWWCNGKISVSYGTDSNGDVDEDWHYEKIQTRKKQDYEVIPVFLGDDIERKYNKKYLI